MKVHKSSNVRAREDGRLTPLAWTETFDLPEPDLDWCFLLDEQNTESIAANIKSRKGVGDIHKVVSNIKYYRGYM